MLSRTVSVQVALAVTAGTALAQWQQASPANHPPACVEPMLASDDTSGTVLLFGGAPSFGQPFAGTWSFDGSNWTQLAPTASPTGRAQAGLVYDQNRGVFVMYGGGNTSFFGGPSIDQTWEFDGTTWTRVITNTTPGGLANMGIAYDTTRHKVVVYGGDPDSFFPIASNALYEYDGNDWTLVGTAHSPGPLERPGMCYDTARGHVVLFGGIDPQIGGTDDTWTYDGTDWSVVPVTGARPAARTWGKMVYDRRRGVCVLQGGMDPMTGTPINDTWEFDGTSWRQVASVPTPSRLAFGMTMDNARHVVVAYGGQDVNFNAVSATWQYGASFAVFGSGCAGSNGTPALHATSMPRLGTTFAAQLTNLPTASAVACMIVGLSNTTSVFGPLPAPLASQGMPGCTAFVSVDTFSVIGAGGGTANWSLQLLPFPAMVGLTVYLQGLAIDPAANAAGLTVSNAGTATLGH